MDGQDTSLMASYRWFLGMIVVFTAAQLVLASAGLPHTRIPVFRTPAPWPSSATAGGFGSLLEHLATLTRNQVRFPGSGTDVPMLTEPTRDQRHAFDLIRAHIPTDPDVVRTTTTQTVDLS